MQTHYIWSFSAYLLFLFASLLNPLILPLLKTVSRRTSQFCEICSYLYLFVGPITSCLLAR